MCKRHNRIKDLFYTIIVFLIIFISPETFIFGTNESEIMRKIGTYIHIPVAYMLFIVCFDTFWGEKKLFDKKKTILSFFILTILCWLTFFVVERGRVEQYVYKTLLMMEAAMLIILLNRECLFNYMNKVLLFFATYSVIVYFLTVLFPSLVAFFPVVSNYLGFKLNFLGFSMTPFAVGTLLRSTGIFREPGVLAVFMMIGLYLSLFEKRRNWKHIIVYIISILLTFSTTAYLVMPILLMVYLIRERNFFINFFNKNRHFNMLIFLIIICLIFVGLNTKYGIRMYNLVFSKFDKTSHAYVSTDARITSIKANIDAAINNPLLGSGAYGANTKFSDYSDTYSVSKTKDNTNTLLILLSQFGFVFFTIVVYLLYSFFRLNNGALDSTLLFISLFLILSGEDLTNNIILYLLIFSGTTVRKLKS